MVQARRFQTVCGVDRQTIRETATIELNAGRGTVQVFVFKIFRVPEWEGLCASGQFAGSPDDRRDGFIHLSAADQVAGTLARHFSDVDRVVIAAIAADRLAAQPGSGDPDARASGSPEAVQGLVWEASRAGALFPHHYGLLFLEAVVTHVAVDRDPQGVLGLPPGWLDAVCAQFTTATDADDGARPAAGGAPDGE